MPGTTGAHGVDGFGQLGTGEVSAMATVRQRAAWRRSYRRGVAAASDGSDFRPRVATQHWDTTLRIGTQTARLGSLRQRRWHAASDTGGRTTRAVGAFMARE
jgi:hypothetical protein